MPAKQSWQKIQNDNAKRAGLAMGRPFPLAAQSRGGQWERHKPLSRLAITPSENERHSMRKSILAKPTEEIAAMVSNAETAIETGTVTVYNAKKQPIELGLRFLTASGACTVTKDENPDAWNAWRAASQVVTNQAMAKSSHGDLAAVRGGHSAKRNTASFGCRMKFDNAGKVPAVTAWADALKKVSELRGLKALLVERQLEAERAAKRAEKAAAAPVK